jgi:hypothetical protein
LTGRRLNEKWWKVSKVDRYMRQERTSPSNASSPAIDIKALKGLAKGSVAYRGHDGTIF